MLVENTVKVNYRKSAIKNTCFVIKLVYKRNDLIHWMYINVTLKNVNVPD